MGDAAARREARRKRILENSQLRLQKITGKCHMETTPDHLERRHEKLENLISNGTISQENLVDSAWDDLMAVENELIDANLATLDSAAPKVSRRTWNSFSNETINDDMDLIQREQINKQNQPFQSSKLQSDYDNSESLLTNLFRKRSCYVFLSLFINLLIFFNLEYTFGSSLLVPFILVLSTRLLICDISQNQKPNLLIAALILSNIRPELINRLRFILNLSLVIFQDFSWFIFSFVIIYSINIKYLHPNPDILSERLDVVLDKQ